MAMKPELKAKWVEALRSGEYEQGQSALCYIDLNTPQYCCLGVLAKITGELVMERGEGVCISEEGRVDESMLTAKQYNVWGLEAGEAEKLADKNDTGWSFLRIATYIKGRKTL